MMDPLSARVLNCVVKALALIPQIVRYGSYVQSSECAIQ